MANNKPETEQQNSVKKEVSIKSARKAEKAIEQASKRADRPAVDSRNTKLKRFSALTIVLAILIVIILNVFLETAIGDKLSYDFTSNQLMTIGEVSDELLSNLDADLRLVVLADEETYETSHRFMPALLNEYAQKSNGHITVEYVNPVTVPTIYDELDPNEVHGLSAGQLVVKNPSNERVRVLSPADLYTTEMNQSTFQQQVTGYKAEASISGAINFVTLETIPTVYFTSGHQEVELGSQFTVLDSLLKNNGFQVEEINLATVGEIPAEAAVLVMMAPQNDLSAPEADKLLQYLTKGGGFLFAAGTFSTTEMPNLNSVLSEYNIQLSTDRVRENDSTRYFVDTPSMMSVNAPVNDITGQAVNGRTMIIDSFYVSQMTNTVEWITVSNLLETSATGSREINGVEDNQTGEGVQTVALMSENRGFMDGSSVTQPARVITLGSASLFADTTFGQVGLQAWYNYSLTYNMLNWLSNDEANADRLLIRDKQLVSYNLTDVTSTTPLQVSAVIATVIIPLSLFIAAIFVYRRRKHL